MTTLRLGSRYQLEERIGAGGAGAVWRGSDVSTGATYAIKLLRSELARNPAMMAGYARERTALLRFRHPGVVVLHDMIVEGDRLALVMDYIAGGDLDGLRRQRGGTVPPAEAAELAAQIGAALAAAWAAGIVHQDLKPANVLLEGGQVRLTDFGIAQLTGKPAVMTAGAAADTVCYVAPEVNDGAEPSSAGDVYALGAMLYELLAGRPPFPGRAALVTYGHQETALARPGGVSDALWALLTACLDKEPSRRPTAAALAAALAEPALAEPALPEPALAEPALAEPVLPEPVLPEPVLPEPVLPEPALDERELADLGLPEPALDEGEPTSPVLDGSAQDGSALDDLALDDRELAELASAEPDHPVSAPAGWAVAERPDPWADSPPWGQPASPDDSFLLSSAGERALTGTSAPDVTTGVPAGPPDAPSGEAGSGAGRPPGRRSRRLAWAGGVLAALAVAGVLAAALNRSPAATVGGTAGPGTASAGATAVGQAAGAVGLAPAVSHSTGSSGGASGTPQPATTGPSVGPTTRPRGRTTASPGQTSVPSLSAVATATSMASSAAPAPLSATPAQSSAPTSSPLPAPSPTPSPSPSPSPSAPVNTAWQCGPTEPATLLKTGAATGQTLQACVRIYDGQLRLRGILRRTVNAWGEQILLELTDPSQDDQGDYISSPCTVSVCSYTVAVAPPSRGDWTVLPEWERYGGNYQSTGAEAGFIDF